MQNFNNKTVEFQRSCLNDMQQLHRLNQQSCCLSSLALRGGGGGDISETNKYLEAAVLMRNTCDDLFCCGYKYYWTPVMCFQFWFNFYLPLTSLLSPSAWKNSQPKKTKTSPKHLSNVLLKPGPCMRRLAVPLNQRIDFQHATQRENQTY